MRREWLAETDLAARSPVGQRATTPHGRKRKRTLIDGIDGDPARYWGLKQTLEAKWDAT